MSDVLTLVPTFNGGGKERLAVIGSGIMGLNTAVHAQELGFPVTLYSAKPPLETTSAKAGASFMPHAVAETPATDQMLGSSWGDYERIAHDSPDAGVRLHVRWEASSFPIKLSRFHKTVAQEPRLYDEPAKIPGGYPHAVRYETFIIDTPTHLTWLEAKFLNAGGTVVERRFTDQEQLAILPEKIIFNCTGLGSKELFNDRELVPVKGQVVVVDAIPDMQYSLSANGFYAYPHKDRTVLGGTAEWHATDEGVDNGATQTILRGSYPLLADHFDNSSLLTIRRAYAGFRPYRNGNVRVEAEAVGSKTVIHNYGHGGSGITLAPGSARQAVALIP